MNIKKGFTLLDIWQGSTDGEYMRHRIPGMVVTDKGTVIIYNEARKESNDWALMDIFAQRSTDHGESFGERIYIAYGNDLHHTVNNPVMMQDKNGRIHFLYCEDYSIRGGRVLRRYSDDDGITWSEPVDITESTMPHYRNAFALGPGHGVTTPDGTLVTPVWMVPKHYNSPVEKHGPSVISTLYSRDNGETWKLGDILTTNYDILSPNETSPCMLSDGRIYLNIRTTCCYRAMAVSRTGYSDWTNYVPDKRLIDPCCFGSVSHYDDGVNPYTVLFANCENKSGRTNVVIKASVSDTVNWEYRRVIDADRGGYVETAADSVNRLIYVLYENRGGETVHLARFDYNWLIGNE